MAILPAMVQSVSAAPTPEQLQMLQQLSPQQQQQALKALQKGSVSGFGNVSGSKEATSLNEPEVVTPRAPDGNAAMEATIKEGTDAPTLEEVKEEKEVTQELKQFGYDLFSGTPTTFAPATDIPIPSNYVVGPGDNIQVQLFGKENAEYDLVVSREGKLRLPGIGPVSVAGLTFSKLQSTLQGRIKRQMIGVKANITMGTLRSIRVFVLGDVERPGSYTVSALSNLTNALFVSGGIKPIGSLRNVQLKRRGKVVSRMDLYDLLLKGDTSGDARLLPGDVIFIPPIGKTVGVAGEVRRPAIYEMKTEQTVQEAIEFAGGFLPTAYTKATQLERITLSGEKTLVDIDASQPLNLKKHIQDGDVLRVYSVLDKMQDIVLISGHVQRPGGAQWRPGMRLTDIVPNIDTLLPKPDLEYTLIKREMPPHRHIEMITTRLSEALKDPKSVYNTELKPRDEVFFFGGGTDREKLIEPIIEQLKQQQRYNQPASIVTVSGNVYHPGTYPLAPNMRLSDLIRAAYDLKPKTDLDYVIVSREDHISGKVSAFSTSIRNTMQANGRDIDIVLKPKDQVFVFTTDAMAEKGIRRQALIEPLIEKLRIQSKQGESAPVVTISGYVRDPGQYPLDQKMQIADLIKAAGGLTESAYTLSAELSRYNVVAGQYREIDHKVINNTQIFAGTISREFTLRPYDTLHVKRVPLWSEQQTIELKGEIKFPGVYPFKRGERLSSVIKRAGGFLDQAFIDGAVFLREELREKEQEQINGMAARLESDLAAMALEQSQVQTADKKSDPQSVAMANSLLKQLRQTQAMGRLVVNLNEINWTENEPGEYDVVLKDGDKLFIPTNTQEVTIIGEVQQSTSHLYAEDKDRDDYINLSGGFTYKADEDRVYIVRANGAVVSEDNTAWYGDSKSVRPGDTIVVPLKADRMKPLTLWANVTQILYQLGIAAAAWQTVGVF
ncbi:MAG: SLBB domain-containing protein [Gammaproteobacteria bacterium]|nr:SLBB domain-containing protein [Gammaproteobacteria bacterium]MDH5799261.1 SLBB domain-containing protein [Gammaproteobacteria bacterium]